MIYWLSLLLLVTKAHEFSFLFQQIPKNWMAEFTMISQCARIIAPGGKQVVELVTFKEDSPRISIKGRKSLLFLLRKRDGRLHRQYWQSPLENAYIHLEPGDLLVLMIFDQKRELSETLSLFNMIRPGNKLREKITGIIKLDERDAAIVLRVTPPSLGVLEFITLAMAEENRALISLMLFVIAFFVFTVVFY